MRKPNFQKLWNSFPDHTKYPTLKDLYTSLGGTVEKNIYVPGFGPNGNTCASRMSVAFNHAGAPINRAIASNAGAQTISAEDGSKIIFNIRHFRNYLLKTLGTPSVDNITPFDDSFRGKKGIICFSVNWSDATGHIALWNGRTYREPSHDNYSTYINSSNSNVKTYLSEFWELS
ncbi:T6SS effector amidase Tae4 family protein [Pokkaliibacter sp. CJK22405]|uniref:T6SS effector amidase Tae4 family protein n=1 Tax=Pokkaliibacter sp. CJK22405 TaxID=3384615 RepID=UPI003984D4F0